MAAEPRAAGEAVVPRLPSASTRPAPTTDAATTGTHPTKCTLEMVAPTAITGATSNTIWRGFGRHLVAHIAPLIDP
jgi:hypothetical protein